MRHYESTKAQTKRKIMDSFWKLYQKKQIEKISIRNITDGCGIYRTTFYLHFSDVYAILEEIERMLLEDLREVFRKSGIEGEKGYEELLYEMFIENYEYLHVFLDENKHPEFSAKYKKELFGQVCRKWKLDLQHMDQKSRLIIEQTFSGILQMLLCWADSSLLSMGEIRRLVEGYLYRGVLETVHSIASGSRTGILDGKFFEY